MSIRCVTLDLDDTLWDCDPVIDAAEEQFYVWLEHHYPEICTRYDRESLLDHRRSAYEQQPHMHHDFTSLRKHWLRCLGKETGHGEGLVETGFDVFWRARNAVKLYDGVPEALARLNANYRVGALTNGNADVHYIGIGHWFHFVVTAADAGHCKPAAAIFHAALAAAEVGAGEAVHVGDHPVNDIQGAAAVGMRTVWVNASGAPWPGDGPEPDVQIQTIEELNEALDGLS